MSFKNLVSPALRRFLFFLLIGFVPGPLLAEQTQRILILDQGDLTNPLRVAHTSAIRAALTGTISPPPEIYAEGLDIDRFPGNKHSRLMTESIRKKYRDREMDLIIAVGLDALDFAMRYRRETGESIPIVFSVIEADAIRRTNLPPQVSGVAIETILKKSVQLASSLIPGTQNVVILGDDESQAIHLIDEEISRQLVEIKFHQEIDVMNGLPVSTVLQNVAKLPKDTVVLYMGITHDSDGHYFSPLAILESIIKASNRPVFVLNGDLIGSGTVGGIAIKATDGTAEVAEIAKRILYGENASNIPVVFIDPKTPIFDSRVLGRWGIPKARLPADSELLYYEPTLWERYSYQIVLIVIVILLQTFFIIALIAEYRRRRRVELRFRRTMTEFAHLSRTISLGELSASIAHELNQPLAAILSNSEAAEILFAGDPPALDEVKRAIHEVKLDSLRASEIIRSMRSLFKKTGFAPGAVDINDIITEAIRFVAWDARAKNVTIATHLPPGLSHVIADRVQLTQVILNLLTNAVEATNGGNAQEKTVTISISSAANDEVVVSVKDNGPGIPADVIDQIFDPFYTTKVHGMGMGLSVSRAIIETHGSRLMAENLEGGVCFSFRLRRQEK